MEKLSSRSFDLEDLSLLAYAEHMAETAQSDSARQLFESYVKQERTRLQAGGARHFSESRMRFAG